MDKPDFLLTIFPFETSGIDGRIYTKITIDFLSA